MTPDEAKSLYEITTSIVNHVIKFKYGSQSIGKMFVAIQIQMEVLFNWAIKGEKRKAGLYGNDFLLDSEQLFQEFSVAIKAAEKAHVPTTDDRSSGV